MRDRLELVGVRPIINVVDLTNYVMLELGQPSHAFDLAKVPDGALIIRLGPRGRAADDARRRRAYPARRHGRGVGSKTVPLALAGIMGGASSEVSDGTRVVALEAAYWHPLTIRRSAKALGMHTEASHRFERGADPEGQPLALDRIAHLLAKIGAGSVRPGIVDQVASRVASRASRSGPARASALLGRRQCPTSATADPARARLRAGSGRMAGAVVARRTSRARWTWSRRWAGTTEPAASRRPFPRRSGVGGLTRPQQAGARAAPPAGRAGLVEMIQLSLATAADARVALANPLSDGAGALRDASCCRACSTRSRPTSARAGATLTLFELGRVFLPGEGGALRETGAAGAGLVGERGAARLVPQGRPADFFDGKGVLEGVGRGAAGRLSWQRGRRPARACIPGKSVRVLVNGRAAGYVGVLHPEQAEVLGARGEIVVAEIDLEPLTEGDPSAVRARALERFPAVTRDLSIVCRQRRRGGRAAGAHPRRGRRRSCASVMVVDRYEGPPVPKAREPDGRAAVPGPARTLTGEEVQRAMARRDRPAARRDTRSGESDGMEHGFELLEEKVRKAAELVKRAAPGEQGSGEAAPQRRRRACRRRRSASRRWRSSTRPRPPTAASGRGARTSEVESAARASARRSAAGSPGWWRSWTSVRVERL